MINIARSSKSQAKRTAVQQPTDIGGSTSEPTIARLNAVILVTQFLKVPEIEARRLCNRWFEQDIYGDRLPIYSVIGLIQLQQMQVVGGHDD